MEYLRPNARISNYDQIIYILKFQFELDLKDDPNLTKLFWVIKNSYLYLVYNKYFKADIKLFD